MGDPLSVLLTRRRKFEGGEDTFEIEKDRITSGNGGVLIGERGCPGKQNYRKIKSKKYRNCTPKKIDSKQDSPDTG